MHHAFLYISLPSLHDFYVKLPNFTFQRLCFSFPELWYSLLEFNSRKICQHLTNWTSWKFDEARIHFLRDVFVAVAAVVAYAPYLKKGVVTLLIGHLLASHADVFRGSSRVPAPLTFSGAGTRDEPLRTSAWEASYPYPQVACVAGAWK